MYNIIMVGLPHVYTVLYVQDKEQTQHHCAKILHCYEPQNPGELRLHKVGEIITEVVSLEHGWCKVNTSFPNTRCSYNYGGD